MSFEPGRITNALSAYMSLTLANRNPVPLPFDEKLFPKRPIPPEGIESLSAGLDGLPPLDWEPVARQCGFIGEALRTGGKDYSQPMWNLTTLCAVFLDEGNKLAHRMGNQHPDYTHESTEQLWDRKNRDHEESGVGWPSCKAIQASGCTACAACPQFAKGRSPLHLALPVATPDPERISSKITAGQLNPVAALMAIRQQGADIGTLLTAMNTAFAAVKYGSKIMVASIVGKELDFMKLEDFHNMLANVAIRKEVESTGESGNRKNTVSDTPISKCWFKWTHRRQYVGRGVLFEPGGPLEIESDMLNLWRGFGIEPKQGDWSLMHDHIRDVICSENRDHFDYIVKWMAYGVQRPDRAIGVAIALRGEEGAGKGFLWRNYGKLFGKHFKHVAQGEHLTGRFNAVLGEACAVFLDEALWAGDRKGEQILKALVTEDTFQLERKFCDPIPVQNRLRIMIASNNQWIVPVGTRGRRYFVLDVSDRYADENDPAHTAYWRPLQEKFGDHALDDGRAAMLYDLLHMDLSGFNIRAVPKSAAKTEQKLLSLRGTTAWLYEALSEGAISKLVSASPEHWNDQNRWPVMGLTIGTEAGYVAYKEFAKERREWQPELKSMWSKCVLKTLGAQVKELRPTVNGKRIRCFEFAPLDACRRQFADYIGDPNLEWEEPDGACSASR